MRLIIYLLSITLLTACGLRQPEVPAGSTQLTVYGVFDNTDQWEPIITAYEQARPEIDIIYKKLRYSEYEQILTNEIAEGRGPDIFMLNNKAFRRQQGKIAPFPIKTISPAEFSKQFVPVTVDDLVFDEQVWGLPLYVDTLALIYSAAHLGSSPPTTWDELDQTVARLTEADTSFSRFASHGLALGPFDNIDRSLDPLYLLMLQNGVDFGNYDQVSLANDTGRDTEGHLINAGVQALERYLAYSNPDEETYAWNAQSPSSRQAFADGQLAMLLGYSYLADYFRQNNTPFSVALAPQLDPENPLVYADYFALAVSKNSPHQEEAWKFLSAITAANPAQAYSQLTGKPVARLDLIDQASADPLLGAYAQQSATARSFPIWHDDRYTEIIRTQLDQVIARKKSPSAALALIQENLNIYLQSKLSLN